ncbi:MAG: class I SAM-dependent methyltransferase [Dissulfurispiraceae bacterium]
MEDALYFPGMGYYAKDSTMIGRAADFYTSPHLHPLFGAMIGKQIEEMWCLLGRPSAFQIVEIGAGMGYLAKDVMDYLKRRMILDRLHYLIIERNPAVVAHQSSLLKDFEGRVIWQNSLADIAPITGCYLSNELLDAFPVRLVEMGDELSEVFVSLNEDDELIEVLKPCECELLNYFREFSIDIHSVMESGYRTEVNLEIRRWIRDVVKKLFRGFVLTIDYGYTADDYYSRERNRGTLLCYHKHQVIENPYINIGEQDITAHVNFSSLKKWGDEAGLKTMGFSPQGSYLISLGMDEVTADMPELTGDIMDTAKIKGLILPEGMGESHKVMVQYKGDKDLKLRGFELRNRKKYL